MLAEAFSWAAWPQATCMPGRCFCEQVAPGLVRQPANAGSSLAFVAVGVWVFWRAARDRNDASRTSVIARHPVYSSLFGAACILIGAGSAFYHASLTFAGQFADVFGMYLIGTFVLLYAVARRGSISPGAAATAYAGLNAALAASLWFVPAARRYLFAILVLAALGFEVRGRRRSGSLAEPRYFARAVGLLAAGFGIWILDINRIVCRPESVLQGHAAWHLLGGASTVCIYLYYRSEIDGRAPLRPGA